MLPVFGGISGRNRIRLNTAVSPASAADSSLLATTFCGLPFASPIVLLSGCVGFGEEYTRVAGFSNRDAGAIVLKGTTLHPRLGNEPHRIAETPMGMLNAIGLQNPGVDTVVSRILPSLDFSENALHRQRLRLHDRGVRGGLPALRQLGHRRHRDQYQLPNVKEGGVAFGNYPDVSARVVAACRKATTKPLITKLSPNQTDIRENARRCIEAGTDAFAVINTLMGMAVDVEKRRPVLANVQGGLSGPAIKPIALLKTWQVYQEAAPAQGADHRPGRDHHGERRAGVPHRGSVGGGRRHRVFYDPLVCPRINAGIADYLRRHGLGNVGELVGSLATDSSPAVVKGVSAAGTAG